MDQGHIDSLQPLCGYILCKDMIVAMIKVLGLGYSIVLRCE